jgi:hypothetical protein
MTEHGFRKKNVKRKQRDLGLTLAMVGTLLMLTWNGPSPKITNGVYSMCEAKFGSAPTSFPLR